MHCGWPKQSPQAQPSLYGSQTPSLLQLVEQNESEPQSGHTQSSSVVHEPLVRHPWQMQLPGVVSLQSAASVHTIVCPDDELACELELELD